MLSDLKEQSYHKPSQWSIIEFSSQKIVHAHALIFKSSFYLERVQIFRGYVHGNGDMNDCRLRMLMSNQAEHKFESQETKLKQIIKPLIVPFEQVQYYQRKVLWSFLRVIWNEIQKNMYAYQLLREDAMFNSEECNQYIKYLLQQLLKSLKNLSLFIRHEIKVYNQYCQSYSILHRLLPDYYSQKMDEHQDGIVFHQKMEMRYQIILDLNRRQLLQVQSNNLLQFIQQEVEKIERRQGQQISLNKNRVLYLLFIPIITGIIGVIYYFSSDNDQQIFRRSMRAWTGSGIYLIYLWINFLFAIYCQNNQINVLLGLGYKSAQQITLFKSIQLFYLLLLTLFYFLLLDFYLLWNNNQLITTLINGILIATWIIQMIHRIIFMRSFESFSSKFSFMHFLTIVIPINDIIDNSPILLRLQTNEKVSNVLYFIITIVSYLLQQKRMEKGDQIYVNLFRFVFVFTIGFQAIHFSSFFTVYNDGFTWTCIALNIVLLCFFIGSRFYPIRIDHFFQGFKDIFTTFYCCLSNNPQWRIKWGRLKLQQANSFHRIIKILLTVISILYVLILPFGIHWTFLQSKLGLQKQVYVGLVMFGYILFNIVYTNQLKVRLKHPLANCTRFIQSVSLFNKNIVKQYAEGKPQDFEFDYVAWVKKEQAKEELYCMRDIYIQKRLEDVINICKNLQDNPDFAMLQE